MFYSGSVDTTDLIGSGLPLGVLLYKKVETRVWAQLYVNQTGSFVADADVFGITNILAMNDLNYLVDYKNWSITNTVLVFHSNLPNNYFSSFQTRLLFPIGGGDGGGGYNCALAGCPAANGACRPPWGPEPAVCVISIPPSTVCTTNRTDIILSDNGYPTSAVVKQQWTDFKYDYLLSSEQGHIWADNWYYCVNVLAEENIPLSMALAYNEIRSSNLPRKFQNITNPVYDDTILITSYEKSLIVNLCAEAENVSFDSRYQTIIDSVESNVNRISNKTTAWVKNNL